MLGNNLTPNREEHTMSISLAEGYEFIKIRDLVYCIAERSYSQLHLKNNKSIIASKPLSFFEDILKNYGFYRVHQSTLINLLNIRRVKADGSTVVMEDGKEFGVAKLRRQGLLQVLALK